MVLYYKFCVFFSFLLKSHYESVFDSDEKQYNFSTGYNVNNNYIFFEIHKHHWKIYNDTMIQLYLCSASFCRIL